eukprot:CAMPEP_0195293864 /NCGR_PEP_ID=MMETSP0707-20130614/13559_1 /TAXON_ID=33640 /ORGANISM="Asterionellopsis glacialis, Strain CCMP134" /LENGTH=216 /DNA_ID=CAMNT_0040354675 /DNA_START=87 /DNA_END=734 /DNA_ORIENTATION=-
MTFLAGGAARMTQIAAKPLLVTFMHSATKKSLNLGTCTAASTSLLLGCRGGASAASQSTGFDLTRTGIRLEGLSSYGVISALLMNASLRVFSMTPRQITKGTSQNKNQHKVERYAEIMFLSFVALSILTGFYTTVVFTLLGLYSKTALGMGKDDAFVKFFIQTEAIRSLAFQSFIISLTSFTASFCLSLFLQYEGKLRWCASGSSAVLVAYGFLHW